MFGEVKKYSKVVQGNNGEFTAYFREANQGLPPGVSLKDLLPPDADAGAILAASTMATSIAPVNTCTYEAEPGVICEQDVPVKMRDGVTIYCDIYRPKDATDIPVIVSWGFFGKNAGQANGEWQIMGVGPGTVSKYAKFESADPMYWCKQGYAMANVDARGAGNSEGDISMFNSQDGRDGYDFIEWIAQQPWCNGKVGLYGNSGIAIAAWHIAAQCPPHLACIAPWEGSTDIYRESLYNGGIPAYSFNEMVMKQAMGKQGVDDQVENAIQFPYINEYWKDKMPDFKKIKIPVYATGGWSHFHLRGSLNGFRKIRSTKKWLRLHRDFEWPDAYDRENLADLRLFFDRYLKDIRNCWESTPRVRVDVMDAYDFDFCKNRPETSFPLKRTEYKKLYLNAADMILNHDLPVETSITKFDSKKGFVNFDIKFTEDVELTGYMKLHLWVSVEDYDNADLFVYVQKLDTKGEFLPTYVLGEPYPGNDGKLRISRRELDLELSTDFQPVQKHTSDQRLKPGEIVPVDVEIYPTSRYWHKGQSLRVQISGHYMREDWFEPFSWDTDNQGTVVIHTGGEYDSFLQVPVIPPKYQDGDIKYGVKE